MTVRVQDMPDRKVQPGIDQQLADKEKPQPKLETAAPVAQPSRAGFIVGLFAVIIGTPFWLEAARYTRDGWINFINWLCARLSIPYTVPALDWRLALGLMIGIGLAYSYIEIGRQPIHWPRKWSDALKLSQWRFERRWEVWAVWIVLIVSDVSTTYSGAKNPDPSGLAIMADIASHVERLAIYAILITFIPDRLIKFGWRSIRGK